jgi:hypothetical protein
MDSRRFLTRRLPQTFMLVSLSDHDAQRSEGVSKNQMSDELSKREADEMEQMSLMVDGEKLYIPPDEGEFAYTGERFREYHPERYAVAVKLIAANQFSDRAIGRFVRANPRVIKQVRLNQVEDIEKQRALLKQKFFVQTAVLGDLVMENAPNCKDIGKLSIAMGISKDSYLAVAGLPTQHILVEKVDVNRKIEQLKEIMAAAREEGRAIKKATVIEDAELEPV